MTDIIEHPSYLIGEEGPLSGHMFSFKKGDHWILGRDPDEASILMEDPMVSRKHAICRLTKDGFTLENLSAVNPITQNGKVVEDVVLLKEGDIVRIGSTFFRFTMNPILEPADEPEPLDSLNEILDLNSARLGEEGTHKWMLKVISGPNSGAEFFMGATSEYKIGKDPTVCEIVFQDLSVSRQHAVIKIDENNAVSIQDLSSKNGVTVNGRPITDTFLLSSQDLVGVGTTSFLILDLWEQNETIISPHHGSADEAESNDQDLNGLATKKASHKDWKDIIIPNKHLGIAFGGLLMLLIVCGMFMALFKTTPIQTPPKNEHQHIQESLSHYPGVQFSFNTQNGQLLIIGHVLTALDKQELMYILKQSPHVRKIEDNVVVDEYVWQNINALLNTNSQWQGISVHSFQPGKFILRGYLATNEQASNLSDYLNLNFPYIDRLDNQVVVEADLNATINNMLIEKGFNGVMFQINNGNLLLQGGLDQTQAPAFQMSTEEMSQIRGIKSIKNYVLFTSKESMGIDLSSNYQVSGYSQKDGKRNSVVINGKILSMGDCLEGMQVIDIQDNVIFLEKDGLKFKINYNLQ
ncbi:MAG: type III secretion system inner membrane ring subunit SctD [Rhabdochlamydiaceae bacterium]